jgi:hypothetical protein
MTPFLPALAADAGALKEDAPDRYTVVQGDTLWSISGRFLKDPWKWPEVWKMNQEQIKNPHRIYPGDVVVLDRSGQQPQLSLVEGTVKLSPRIRVETLKDAAVPAIPPSAIEPFLSRPLVVGQTELDEVPSIMATQETRVAIGAGDRAYVAGLTQDKGVVWQLYRRGDALIDPDTNENLGYLAIYLGEARVLKFADISTIEITKSLQEIYVGDRLLPAARDVPTFSYVPRAPLKSVRGRIVSTYGNLGETGPPAGIVALSRGSRDGLEVGHVLAILRSQSTAEYGSQVAPLSQYGVRTSPIYGREGPSGSNNPRTFYSEQLLPRDAPIYEGGKPISAKEASALPDERYGLVMVFRTFDRAAFGLVMQASRPVAVNDIVSNP